MADRSFATCLQQKEGSLSRSARRRQQRRRKAEWKMLEGLGVRTYCMSHITCMSVRAVCVAFVLSPLLPVPTYLPTDQPLSPLQLPYTCTHGARSAARSAWHSNCSVFMDTHGLGYVARVATGSWQRHTRPRRGTGASHACGGRWATVPASKPAT